MTKRAFDVSVDFVDHTSYMALLLSEESGSANSNVPLELKFVKRCPICVYCPRTQQVHGTGLTRPSHRGPTQDSSREVLWPEKRRSLSQLALERAASGIWSIAISWQWLASENSFD